MYGIVNDALVMRRDDEATSCCRWPKTGVDVSLGLRGVPISRSAWNPDFGPRLNSYFIYLCEFFTLVRHLT